MRRTIRIFIWTLSFWPILLLSQQTGSLRTRSLPVVNDTIVLENTSIVPGSIHVFYPDSTRVADSLFVIDYLWSTLVFREEIARTDTVLVDYRVFPINFTQTYRNKSDSLLEPDFVEYTDPFASTYSPSEDIDEIFRLDGLNKSGSISRGINFGNNQDVVVNSNFNLQLSGKLSQDVDILAAISDNNVPVQPYGNTQLIQEFDKVFIRLDHRLMRLVAGDFFLKKPDSYFMNFNKKLQGGEFTVRTDNNKYRARVAAALSKGKFTRNRIQGTEGNQGPYKLTGADGESFIIVLAGSEKVYIDGKLMTRGESHDYVIDYNTAEITFTPNILITKDKRIVVEFEYSDQRYARSLFFAGNTLDFEKVRVDVNFYSEQDLRNQTLQQDLSDEEKAFLSTIGDNVEEAYVLNVDSAGFTSDQVRYKLADTTVNNVTYDSIFIYTTDPDSGLYRVGFANLGPQKGNYVLLTTGVNGRVYKWVAPLNGVPQGSYDPVRLLVTPKKTQMVTTRVDWEISPRTSMFSEIAVSSFDINTFASNGNNDNSDIAVNGGISNESTLKEGPSNTWKLDSRMDLEYRGSHFTPIERYRPVEFERDWNLNDSLLNNDQVLAGASFRVSDKKFGNARYGFEALLIGEEYTGLKNLLGFHVDHRKFKFIFDGNYLSTRQEDIHTGFLRQQAEISRSFKKLVIGVRQEQENNRIFYRQSDSLASSSFSFFEWEAFLRAPDTARNPYAISYKQRIDRLPLNNRLEKATTGREIAASFSLLEKASNRFTVGGTYRFLEVNDTTLSRETPENTIVGRLEHYLRLFKGAVTFNTYYELGSGLENKQEFYYLKVAAGEGTFMWIDYNGDGVEQLNEFEVAPFRDQGEYIRAFSQSNEFVRNYFSKFTESVNIQPAAVWKKEEGWKGIIARFSNQLVFRTDRKALQSDPGIAYNPFAGKAGLADTTLVSLNTSFRNTLYYNRISPKFSIDLTIQTNTGKNLLVSGFESRYQLGRIANARWNFFKPFTLLIKYENGIRERRSDYFESSNYNIIYNEVRPSLSIQPSVKLRIDLIYSFSFKENTPEEKNVISRSHDAGIEFNFRIVNKGNLLCKANYINIYYDGEQNSPLAFEMLQGFQPGKNATWSVSYQQNLSRFLQLNLVYDGRKGEDTSMVHVGSVQLRAHF